MVGGAVQSAVLLGSTPLEWHIVAATDLDGDKIADILLENVNDGVRAAWLENGQGGVRSAPVLTILSPVWHMATALIPDQREAIANAGPDQDRNLGEATTLNGSASIDAGGATFTWTQVSGPNVTGPGGTLTGVAPTFNAPNIVSTLEFDLRITRGTLTTATDRVMISVFEDKAHKYFVAISGSDLNSGTRESPFRTIQAAINKAANEGLNGDVYSQGGPAAIIGQMT